MKWHKAIRSIMPSYGSDGVALNFDAIVTSKDNLEKTELYSWIEFDGLMYLQQNGIVGIAEFIEKMEATARSVR